MTIHLEFTPELISEIRYQRYNHLVPLVQRRMETLLLKAYNLSPEQIEEIVGVSAPAAQPLVRDFHRRDGHWPGGGRDPPANGHDVFGGGQRGNPH